MHTKLLTPSRVTVKNADTGEVEAVFATLGVKDSDGDVIESGAITDGATVAISAYGHSVWKGAPPAGVGTIHEEGDELVMKGRYFLDTDHGRNDFHTVKGLAEAGKGEWSFGLINVVSTKATRNGVTANYISKVDVPEVSPVFMGAGVNTRTLVAKGRKEWDSIVRQQLREAGLERWGDDDTHVWIMDHDTAAGTVIYELYSSDEERLIQVDYTSGDDGVSLGDTETEVERRTTYAPKTGLKFSEHLTSVLADVKALTTRAEEVMALRAAKGKTLSDDTVEVLVSIDAALAGLKSLIDEPAPTSTTDDDIDVDAEFARFVSLTQGVPL